MLCQPQISYKQAVAAVFIEGWIFVFIALTGVRGKLIQLVPKSVMLATAGGIGIFLAFIGLQGSEGLGMIVYDSATLVTLGESRPQPSPRLPRSSNPTPLPWCVVCCQLMCKHRLTIPCTQATESLVCPPFWHERLCSVCDRSMPCEFVPCFLFCSENTNRAHHGMLTDITAYASAGGLMAGSPVM